jgi:DNA-binding MarR family transcriptional regulator
VTSKLQDELKQTKPWSCLEEEALLNIARTSAVVEHTLGQVLKRFAITSTQYNILRILRGAGRAGLCRNEVGERLVRSVPDVTRLLDRMEEMELIDRTRDGSDRRFVTTRITAKGLALVDELDAPLQEFQRDILAHMDEHQLRTLIALLETVRARP